MNDLTGGRNIAEYDWCWLFLDGDCACDHDCGCIDEFLHSAGPTEVRIFDDWDGDNVEGRTACSKTGILTIPGVGSRISDPRCPQCCEAVGLPPGIGSPKNDGDCRRILGMS